MALLGLAPVQSARASAANPRESISACRHDDLGVANGKVTIEVTDYACPQHSCARGEPTVRAALLGSTIAIRVKFRLDAGAKPSLIGSVF
jgi:hypothetical protein